MMGPPLLLLGADRIGFTRTTSAAAAVALVVLLPLALFVLRRRPEDMGLSPDGLPRAQEINHARARNGIERTHYEPPRYRQP